MLIKYLPTNFPVGNKSRPRNEIFFRAKKLSVCFLFIMVFVFVQSQIYSQPLALGKKKFVGNVIHDGNNIRSDFLKYWNQVTPENAGKWGSVEYTQGSYGFTQLDNIYKYALSHNFPFKFHNLIWGQQQPGFLTGLDSAQQYQEIVKWIDTTGQRYPQSAFCDVVNEPIHNPPSYKDALGGNGATGWDWVIKAFELARKYWSPNAKLLINEYSVINDASANGEYLQIINLLKDRGLIDGIGVQCHYFEVDGGVPVATLKRNLDKLTATGLPVYISEFDINQQDDNVQLQRYQSIFPMLYEEPGVEGITLWGYTQYETWRPYTYLVTDRLAQRPALQWLRTYLAEYLSAELISPVGSASEPRNPILVWHTSTSATMYNVQVAADSNFSSALIDSSVADTLLQLDTLAANTKFYWRVMAMNAGDSGGYSTAASFTTGDKITGVKEASTVTAGFLLMQNFPNPFNPSTVIRYSIPRRSFVTLIIYNSLGQKVTTLVNKEQNAGAYAVTFDASKLTSGVYFYSLLANNLFITKKLVLLK